MKRIPCLARDGSAAKSFWNGLSGSLCKNLVAAGADNRLSRSISFLLQTLLADAFRHTKRELQDSVLCETKV